jgi:hypothetical protein
MPFFKVLAVLAVSSLAAAGGASAGASTAAGPKGQKAPTIVKSAQPAGHTAAEAPIVMGRSVGIVRKSKLHHIKAKPAHPHVPSKN